jgi:predicted transposase YdaD
MRYISSVERIGIEKGLLQGREEGRQEGHHEGLLEADQNTLRRLLIRRFKITLPDWVEQRIAQASQQELEQWLDNIIEAETIEAVLGVEDSAK